MTSAVFGFTWRSPELKGIMVSWELSITQITLPSSEVSRLCLCHPRSLNLSFKYFEKRFFFSYTCSFFCTAWAVVSKDCRYPLCKSDWDSTSQQVSKTVSVVASKTEIQSGTKDLLLSFADLFVADISPYHQIFRGFKIPSVQVNRLHYIKGHLKKCKLGNKLSCVFLAWTFTHMKI